MPGIEGSADMDVMGPEVGEEGLPVQVFGRRSGDLSASTDSRHQKSAMYDEGKRERSECLQLNTCSVTG